MLYDSVQATDSEKKTEDISASYYPLIKVSREEDEIRVHVDT